MFRFLKSLFVQTESILLTLPNKGPHYKFRYDSVKKIQPSINSPQDCDHQFKPKFYDPFTKKQKLVKERGL